MRKTKSRKYVIYRINKMTNIKEYYTTIAWVASKTRATKYKIENVASIAANLNCKYERV